MTRSRTRAPSRGRALPLREFLDLEAPSGNREVDVDGAVVPLTHLDRVYWPREGITKFEALRYYATAWLRLEAFVKDRPAVLKRFPRGIAGPPFFQHDLREGPPWLRRVTLVNQEGRTIHYAVHGSLAGLLYLVNAGALEVHVWLSRVGSLDHPDVAAIDLDPGDRVEWRRIEELALRTREILSDEWGVRGYPKTSGSRGIHILVPLDGRRRYDELAPACRTLATKIAERASSIATVERPLKKRDPEKIYVDLLQNARGKAIAAPFSIRVRPGATVSTPLSWERIAQGVDPGTFTIRTPWEDLDRDHAAWKPLASPPGTAGG